MLPSKLEQVTEGWSSWVLNTSKDGDFTAALGPHSVFYQAHWHVFPLARFVRWSKPHHLALPLFSQVQSGNNTIIIFLKVVRDLLMRSMVIASYSFLLTRFELKPENSNNFKCKHTKANSFFLEVEKRTIKSYSQISAACSCCLQRWDVSLDVRDFASVKGSQKWESQRLNHSLSWDGGFLHQR